MHLNSYLFSIDTLMDKLHALYFPDTSITTRHVSQELLFFDKISCFQASETDETIDPLANLGLCEGYPPVPFNDQIDRFRHLIRELKGNEGEFYSGQLSRMSLDYLESRDESTVKNLISAISGQNDTPATAAEQTKNHEELWQARLLLKLAEILYREEEELQEGLSAVTDKETELFDALKGESGFAFSLPEIPIKNRLHIRPQILINAWAKLFVHDNQQSHQLLTCTEEDAESLFEINEAISKQRPVRLFRIPLPHTTGMDIDDYLSKRSTFRGNAKELMTAFTTLISSVIEDGIQPDTLQKSATLAAEWTRLFAVSGPWGQDMVNPFHKPDGPGEPHLEVYLCNKSLETLMRHFAKAETAASTKTDSSPAIIAIKSRKASTCG